MQSVETEQLLARLITALQLFAQSQTNPVLSLLAGQSIVEQVHYPAEAMDFQHIGLKAYYHCHPQEHRFEGEHGHFHIFLQHEDKWSHLIALSVDPQGQPLRWFTVNHWVSAGEWCDARTLSSLLQALPNTDELSPVEAWLLALMKFYQRDIDHLLCLRDETIALKNQHKSDVLNDRQLYILSSSEIELLSRIKEFTQA